MKTERYRKDGEQRADEPHDRTHRKIDVSCNDHQQHPDGHDHDIRVLQHQIGEVGGPKQDAVGGNLEKHHDGDERQQNAVLAHMSAQIAERSGADA